MGNITISNNGNDHDIPAQFDADGNEIAPAVSKDPAITVTDTLGNVYVINPGTSMGIAYKILNITVNE